MCGKIIDHYVYVNDNNEFCINDSLEYLSIEFCSPEMIFYDDVYYLKKHKGQYLLNVRMGSETNDDLYLKSINIKVINPENNEKYDCDELFIGEICATCKNDKDENDIRYWYLKDDRFYFGRNIHIYEEEKREYYTKVIDFDYIYKDIQGENLIVKLKIEIEHNNKIEIFDKEYHLKRTKESFTVYPGDDFWKRLFK